MALVIQKFGGSSLSTTEHFKIIAQKITQRVRKGEKFIIVVSAMGETTDHLIDLANQISKSPNQRELDMLLTSGERISMSLLSIALWEHNVSALSFTGSQAGILTTANHSNAHIIDIKPYRLEKTLLSTDVIVLAGFQGVCPETKEVTTLGRGGSDTSAVAMASFFRQSSCEIYKDVEGISSGNPKVIPSTQCYSEIHYDAVIEMSFWGSEVLHTRSLILAKKYNVQIQIGHSQTFKIGTRIMNEVPFELNKALSVSSNDFLVHIEIGSSTLHDGFQKLKLFLNKNQLYSLKLLASTQGNSSSRFMMTGPEEQLRIMKEKIKEENDWSNQSEDLCSLSLTYSSPICHDSYFGVHEALLEEGIEIYKFILSPLSLNFVIHPKDKIRALQLIHEKWIN